MKSSVLMSVYYKEKPEYLKLALESIYEQQTRKPDEIVVVFDGPLTPELYAVLDTFRQGKEDVVFYYPQDVNRGTGTALYVGLGKCTGDYILKMDSDDISLPDRFEKQLVYMEAHPEVDALGGIIAEFNQTPDEEPKRMRVCPEKHEDIVKMGKSRNPMNHVTYCAKRSALEKCGGYQSLLFLEDYYLWLRMIAAGCRLENLQQILVNVRIGNGFYNRRAGTVRVKGWHTLQKFMLEHKMINPAEALRNMLYIIGATYCPKFVRKWVYAKLLRK